MAIYGISIDCAAPSRALLDALRKLAPNTPLRDIKERLRTNSVIKTWNSHEYDLTEDSADAIAAIRAELVSLTGMGVTWQLSYRPSTEDPWEQVTVDQALNLLEAELTYDLQQHD